MFRKYAADNIFGNIGEGFNSMSPVLRYAYAHAEGLGDLYQHIPNHVNTGCWGLVQIETKCNNNTDEKKLNENERYQNKKAHP